MTERRPSILIVEEDKMAITFYHFVLSDCYRLLITENLLEATKIIEKENIECIILDLSLSRWGGDEFLTKFIRQEHKNLKTTTLGVALNPYLVDRQRALGAECDGYIVKPINVEILLETIASLVNTRQINQIA